MNTKLEKVIARTWIDPEFKRQLKLDPRTALAEMGFEVPENIEVQVVENLPGKVYLTLPVAPWSEGVTDAEMDPLIQTKAPSVCSKTYSCCCAHPDVVRPLGSAANS